MCGMWRAEHATVTFRTTSRQVGKHSDRDFIDLILRAEPALELELHKQHD